MSIEWTGNDPPESILSCLCGQELRIVPLDERQDIKIEIRSDGRRRVHRCTLCPNPYVPKYTRRGTLHVASGRPAKGGRMV